MSSMRLDNPLVRLLVLFDTETGGTDALAHALAEGMRDIADCVVDLRRVPQLSAKATDDVAAVVVLTDATQLADYDGIAFGAPVHFANMSAAMRAFLDGTVPLWTRGALQGKPATVFMGAGSGAGREAAILSFWHSLAMHGMVLVPPGIAGTAQIDPRVPQANTPFGAVSAHGMPGSERPSQGERLIARVQGAALAQVARALRFADVKRPAAPQDGGITVEARLEAMGLTLPEAPAPVGNYRSWRRAGQLVFINQIALVGGAIAVAGTIGDGVSDAQAREATRATLLNALAVLKEAVGDLARVRTCVQMTGFFATPPDYAQHAALLDEASGILVRIWGEAGKPARAAVGATSLPLRSPCELQLIFEVA